MTPIRSNGYMAVDGHRKHEAIVVVCVFADQVDTPGRDDEPARWPAEPAGERSLRGLREPVQ